jgi:hypothetical protein
MTLLFTIYLVSAILCALGMAVASRVYLADEDGEKGKTFAIKDIDEVFISVFIAVIPGANTLCIYFIWADATVGDAHWVNRVLYRIFTGKSWRK